MWIYDMMSIILEMSFMATVVILAVLLVRMLFGRFPKIFRYVLWSVVLFRLLCPMSVTSSFSLFQVFEITDAQVLSEQVPVSIQENSQEAVTSQIDYDNVAIENIDETKNTVEITNEKQAELELREFGRQSMAVIWLTGVGIMFFYSIFSMLHLKKELVGTLKISEQIYLSDYIKTPFVMGIIKPRIYLPSSLSEEEKEYIILHEQIHLKRGDHIWRFLGYLALAIHWFNPFVWLAYFLSGVDMEMSCDEAVMKKVGVDIRAAYSTSLLSLATGKRYINGALLAFGEGNVKNRIKNIMKFRKPALVTIVVAVLTVIVLIVVMGSNPKAEPAEIHTKPENDIIVLEESTGTSYEYVEGQTETENNEDILQARQEAMVEELDNVEDRLEEVKEKAEQLGEAELREQIELWAKTFCRRDGKTINSMITPEVKAAMIESGIHQGDEGGVGFGWSSPWPWGEDTDYRILEVTDSTATILYYAWVSDPHVWVWRETLHFYEEDGRIVIDAEELKEMYDICSVEEFLQAYPDGITGTPMDYLNEPMITDDSYETTGEILNFQALLSSSNFYQHLFSPDTAAVYLLNLLDNPNKVKTDVRMDSDGSVSVIVIFLEYGEGFIVNMVQPYGEAGIWLVEDIEIDFDKID